MAEHHASVEVNAPTHQVYTLFSHLNDFPKYMRFVKEVTYYDEQRSHWVAQIAGRHEWDAINEGWVADSQVGWRSTNGLENQGKVTFQAIGPNRTLVDVFLYYNPPYGKLGAIAEALAINTQFDHDLQEDLNNFARMVEQTPAGATEPMASHYLFNEQSALGSGTATDQQKTSMSQDPLMSEGALGKRDETLQQQNQAMQQAQQSEQQRQRQARERQQQSQQAMRSDLEQQAQLDQQARAEQQKMQRQQAELASHESMDQDTLNARAIIGGRGPASTNRPLGDMDARTARFPGNEQDEMAARRVPANPNQKEQPQDTLNPSVHQSEDESPWTRSIESEEEEGH
ncbi:MAG TPA: SRPBCC family protein [Ktedonobacteraceae bacterium]|jgi:hypothetical protein|nr:SRPBCC family protein [Ktedonobacteraceae bacterium]